MLAALIFEARASCKTPAPPGPMVFRTAVSAGSRNRTPPGSGDVGRGRPRRDGVGREGPERSELPHGPNCDPVVQLLVGGVLAVLRTDHGDQCEQRARTHGIGDVLAVDVPADVVAPRVSAESTPSRPRYASSTGSSGSPSAPTRSAGRGISACSTRREGCPAPRTRRRVAARRAVARAGRPPRSTGLRGRPSPAHCAGTAADDPGTTLRRFRAGRGAVWSTRRYALFIEKNLEILIFRGDVDETS